MIKTRAVVDTKSILAVMQRKAQKAAELMGEEAKDIIENDIMGTWDTKYPVTVKVSRNRSRNWQAVIVWGSNPGPRGRVPFWLTYGTSKGYFVVSNDWTSKTSKSTLVSGQGSGTIRIVPFIANDGIEPRNYHLKIAEALRLRTPQILKTKRVYS